jgi:hypothetical protein
MGLNILTATGNLGKDATQRYTPNGDSIVSFSLPLEAGYGKNQVTTWINCSVFGKAGEGKERQSLELRVEKVRLLGSRPSETSASGVSQTESNSAGGSFDSLDDDIPFANPYKGRAAYAI